jgi:hypothetical protein
MVPAASIKVQLRDETGAALTRWSVCLGGEKLPPSSSVFACVDTDGNGHFSLKDVPTTGHWWLAVHNQGDRKRNLPPGPAFRSEEFNLAEPGRHDFDAQLNHADTTHRLKIQH